MAYTCTALQNLSLDQLMLIWVANLMPLFLLSRQAYDLSHLSRNNKNLRCLDVWTNGTNYN